jgi:multidrug resistance protein MdtO
VVAAASVPIIWARPGSFRPDLETVVWTAFGIMLGTLATVLTEWMFASGGTAPGSPNPQPFFVADAFSNPAYVRFALKGCLAASICYVFWAAAGWPGLGVCTVTCVIAAPVANLGSSRQRLTTRLVGLFTGGVICGIGSQVFLLPSVDSIVGFTILFAAVSAAAAWFVTSSPRLNYFGRQMALAYYLTMFQGFGINESLTMSRDRLTGILLGLVVMWLVFDVCSGEDR